MGYRLVDTIYTLYMVSSIASLGSHKVLDCSGDQRAGLFWFTTPYDSPRRGEKRCRMARRGVGHRRMLTDSSAPLETKSSDVEDRGTYVFFAWRTMSSWLIYVDFYGVNIWFVTIKWKEAMEMRLYLIGGLVVWNMTFMTFASYWEWNNHPN